jgi:adenylylsulfate reductase subunit A
MEEWLAGRGPTYCDTRNMAPHLVDAMMKDYLNERPSFVLFLAARGQDVTREPIEIYGSDPYIVGGHTMGGFWVDISRMTTVSGLFAAGETAGGNPNKFVGGWRPRASWPPAEPSLSCGTAMRPCPRRSLPG